MTAESPIDHNYRITSAGTPTRQKTSQNRLTPRCFADCVYVVETQLDPIRTMFGQLDCSRFPIILGTGHEIKKLTSKSATFAAILAFQNAVDYQRGDSSHSIYPFNPLKVTCT
jgi:hypothetical protein